MEASDFPEPTGLVRDVLEPDRFDRTSTTWDYLVNRTVRLVRRGISHHQESLKHTSIPESLLEEQHRLLRCLTIWNQHYKTANIAHMVATGHDFESQLHRQMEGIIGKIWVACCLGRSEMRYDTYIADFEEVLRLSQQLVDRRSLGGYQNLPKFIFEIGL